MTENHENTLFAAFYSELNRRLLTDRVDKLDPRRQPRRRVGA